MTNDDSWVLLSYRLPRVPSTPRAAVWRKLNRLGVVQLGDGLVALPADARTREALEWVAEDIVENHGEAIVWLGHPIDKASGATLEQRMTESTAAEYETVIAEARANRGASPATRRRVMARLRRELHRIGDRDFFTTPQRDAARLAVEELDNESAQIGTS
ncbi:MAG: Chromate resistance protein ChrB [Microbacteriaceae bacterium]